MTIKEARLAVGLSQQDFAREINVSISTVRNWEQGRTSISSVNAYTLLAIARVCDLNRIDQLKYLIIDSDIKLRK